MIHIVLPDYPIQVYIEPAPASFKRFQKDLTKVGGRTPTGEPVLRLVWGGEATDFWAGFTVMKYPFVRTFVDTRKVLIGQDDTGEDLFLRLPYDRNKWSEEHMKLYGDRVDIIEREIHEAGEPYWAIEEWLPPEKACQGWEEGRYYFKPGYFTADATGAVDLLGPAPTIGAWRRLFRLEDREGKPRPPETADITRIERAIQARLNSPDYTGWGQRDDTPSHILRRNVKAKYDKINEQDERDFNDTKQRMDVASRRALIRQGLIQPESAYSVPTSLANIIKKDEE